MLKIRAEIIVAYCEHFASFFIDEIEQIHLNLDSSLKVGHRDVACQSFAIFICFNIVNFKNVKSVCILLIQP